MSSKLSKKHSKDLAMAKLLLVDGNALVHRAYHALPPLTAPDGKLVNAVYGFMSSLLSAISVHRPRYLAVAFDVAGKTFRNELYEAYKATRQPADQALYDQIPIIQQLLNVMNVPIFGVAGYEADDVLATIINQIKNQKSKIKNLESTILTGDNDVLQLVSDNVSVYSVSRGEKQAVTYDEAGVKQRYDISPRFLADFKALAGDPSDNIKGAPGIGPKRAAELINRYGSLEQILKHIEELKSLKQDLMLAKKIVTLVKDVPLDFNLEQSRLRDYDPAKVRAALLKLGFKSLLKRLPEGKPAHRRGKQEKLF